MKNEYLQPNISSFYDGTIVSQQYKKFSDVGEIFENTKYKKIVLFMLKDRKNLYKIERIFKNYKDDDDLEHLFKSSDKISFYEDCMILLLSRFFFYYDLPVTLKNISIFEENL